MRKLENDVGEAAERAPRRTGPPDPRRQLESSATVLARLRQVRRSSARSGSVATPPRDRRPFGAVHSLYDYVARPEGRLPPSCSASPRSSAGPAGRTGSTVEEWRRVELPLPPLRPPTVRHRDLPAELARSFQERDGTRASSSTSSPPPAGDDNDMRFTSSAGPTPSRGCSYPGRGRSTGPDVRSSSRTCWWRCSAVMPRALALSMVLTVAAVASTFRRGRFTALVIGSCCSACSGSRRCCRSSGCASTSSMWWPSR